MRLARNFARFYLTYYDRGPVFTSLIGSFTILIVFIALGWLLLASKWLIRFQSDLYFILAAPIVLLVSFLFFDYISSYNLGCYGQAWCF